MKGWVYIISNDALRDLIKVGFSTKDPELRAKELNNTGMPKPYRVDYEILVDNPRRLEEETHKELAEYNEGKEWFACDLSKAVSAIRKIVSSNFYYESDFEESQERSPRETNASTPMVMTRNTICACGSGKKYKHCCGSLRE